MRFIEKEEKDEDIIEIQEDTPIPGTDVILEEGDKIKVLPKEDNEE